MALAYIDDTGLHLPDYPAVLDDLEKRVRAVFGEDVYLEPDSQDGQMLAVFALAVHEAYSLAGSVYNSYSPHTAQGAGLSRMVVINGIRRAAAGKSTVDLTLVGQNGTVIQGGIARDAAGNNWRLPGTVAIGPSGQVTVTAVAEKDGTIHAAPGEVRAIVTPCRGWQTVNNTLPAVPGAPVELDAELRARQYYSTALPSRTVFDGTVGAVAAVDGVIRWRGYENDNYLPDANGIPPHHICLVVEGGDSRAIAGAIAVKKTPGTGTYGDVVIDTQDDRGAPNTIRFFRPVNVPVRAIITLAPRGGYLSTTGVAIRDAVAAHINDLPIGEDVLLSRLFCPINDADVPANSPAANATGRTFDIVSVRIGPAGGAMAQANVAIGFREAAICYAEDVEVYLG